jgi:hypothetical protein
VAAIVVATLVISPVSARPQAPPAPRSIGVSEGGVMVRGWSGRLDETGGSLFALRFTASNGGYQITTGPAAIFWQPGATSIARGQYRLSATFTQLKPSDHPNAYGLLIGGADLGGANPRYTYFVVREDGKYLIRKRAGTEVPILVDWTDSNAVNKLDGKGRATNALAIEVGANRVRFLANGKEVATQPRSAVDGDGFVGLRVNHNLDVQVSDLQVTPTES